MPYIRTAKKLDADGGMGSQFTPRIDQEVLVHFLEGDIDRPTPGVTPAPPAQATPRTHYRHRIRKKYT